jgi:tRNA pseudouridine55 synthase
MQKVIRTHKNIGETPLEALERVRKVEKISAKTPMTYAGRLDPAAEGVLILLVGDECKKKDEYTKLDKVYEIEVMFGVETDTQDSLGLITKINVDQKKQTFDIDYQKYVGKFTQEYPAYSSKMIAAKEVDEIPTKDVEIYSIKKLGEAEVSGHEAGVHALEIISKVNGEFRQREIGEEWYAFGEEFGNFPFKVVTLEVKCSSGTYMRSLAERIGKDAGVGAFAYSITRTGIKI